MSLEKKYENIKNTLSLPPPNLIKSQIPLLKETKHFQWKPQSAYRIAQEYKKFHEEEKSAFIKEIQHTFEKNVSERKTKFKVCDNINREWKKKILEDLFFNQGYEISYHYEENRAGVGLTFAQLIIPQTDFMR